MQNFQNTVIHSTYGNVHINNSSAQGSELKEKIAKWLAGPDPSIIHNRLLEQHHEGTGEWFLKSETFQRWMKEEASNLWIQGIPGNGKSVLCSTVIEHLQKECCSRHVPILYYYFDFRDPSTQRVDNFLRSLVLQLLYELMELPSALKKLYSKHKKGKSRPSIDELTTCFLEIVASQVEVRALGDAFDECSEWNSLWKFLSHIVKTRSPNFHFLFTSRPESYIRDACNAFAIPSIDLRCDGINADIAAFVSEVLQHDICYHRIPSNIKTHIHDKLLEHASGMFRWAALHLDSLHKCRSIASLKAALSSLPPSLDETYSRIMQKIDDINRPHVHRILQWVCFSFEPLSVKDAASIASVADHVQPPFDTESMLFNPEDILDICGGFLSMTSPDFYIKRGIYLTPLRPSGKQNKIPAIILSHLSVKEYFLSSLASPWHITEEDAHATIIRSSVALALHLSPPPELALPDIIPMNNFLTDHVCVRLWAHLHYIPSTYPHLMESIQILFNFKVQKSRSVLWQLHHNWPLSSNGRDVELPPVASFSIAAYHGLTDILRYMVAQDGFQLDMLKSAYPIDSPLCEAVGRGHTTTVEFLLSVQTNIDDVEPPGKTALLVAINKRSTIMVKLLIDYGVNVRKGRDYLGRTALHCAVICCDTKIVRWLIEAGANEDVNTESRSDIYPTPIFSATVDNRFDIVEMLIEAGADVNKLPRGGISQTVLDLAWYYGHDELAQLLLANGAMLSQDLPKLSQDLPKPDLERH